MVERFTPLLNKSFVGNDNELITVKKVAVYLKVETSFIYDKVHKREIPIDNTLKEMFNITLRELESIYVFTGPETGDPYKSVKRSFDTELKKTCTSNFHFHGLRHYICTSRGNGGY